ncbi:hypothetical protein GmHk_01G001287 [Glycine max]|nr:hypothetical protein GmHk_01G001287 [Glycine max]
MMDRDTLGCSGWRGVEDSPLQPPISGGVHGASMEDVHLDRLIRQVCEVLIFSFSLSQSAGLASHPLSAPLLRLSVRKNLEEG